MSIDTGSIYDQLLKLEIHLDFKDIPTPSYLQEKILECSDNTRVVEKRMIEVTREFSMKERDLKLEQVRLEVKRRNLLINNPEIKKLPTGKEREAAADSMLEKEHDTVVALSNDSMELQNLLSSIKLVHQNLRTTNSDIRMLMRIMEQQIYKLNVGSKSDKEVSELLAGLGEVEKLEDELTPDDVESTSQGIEPDDLDGLSEGATQKPDTAPEEVGGENGDDLEAIDSFLSEDPEEIGGQTTTPSDDTEDNGGEGPAQSAVGSVVSNEHDGDQHPTEVTGNGDGGPVTNGLDIDLGGILDEPKEIATVSSVANPQEKPLVERGGDFKKEPPQKEGELDIDDILNSLS